MPRLRVALAQTNPVVGDFQANITGLITACHSAYNQGAQVVVAGELALSGYPIEDLALRDTFLTTGTRSATVLAKRLAEEGMADLVVLVGHPDGPHPTPTTPFTPTHPQRAQNVVSVCHGGGVVARYAKHHLPNYGVFDEFRTFIPGSDNLIVRVGGVDCGVIICEDLWRDDGPVHTLTGYPIGLLLVPNASPFERDKDDVRLPLVTHRATTMNTTVCYTNIVGGQDDLVFDGDSMVVRADGQLAAKSPQFVDSVTVVDCDVPAADTTAILPPGTRLVEVPARDITHPVAVTPVIAHTLDDNEQLWQALVLGLRDYVEKNGFRSVIMGLSGGIDSAVCAALAVDAIGPHRVVGVSMPSVYSSDHSKDDAADAAARLGISYRRESIEDLVAPFDTQLQLSGLAAENVQARARGVILMSLSNLEGHLVLTTGNKTELAVGYSTIYGDSVGGFAPIKDVPKMLVWELAKWRNQVAEKRGETAPIPPNSIAKPPSAELRPGQLDQDSLPDYALLDAILDLFIVQGLDVPDIVTKGFDEDTVRSVVTLVDRAEWKRRQGAIGPRISSVAFGRDRRLPVTARRTPPEGE
jgi:NAD+ synthase (glutamine-hydrolysing)